MSIGVSKKQGPVSTQAAAPKQEAAPAPKKPATEQKAATGWAPKAAGDTAPRRSTGWAPQDNPAKLAGTFTAQGAGIKSLTLTEDGRATIVGSDGATTKTEFAFAGGGAAFGDTFSLKGSDGSVRLFGVSEVQRDASGKITSLQLGEFVGGSPRNIEPLTLSR